MLIIDNHSGERSLKHLELTAELTVVGGGLAGTCAAIQAAREGVKVVLIQDRPVLGGNASSEVRLWALGATSHMGNNNRWAREGGLIDEICVENTYRNPEGNPLMFDVLLLEKVKLEENITLLLNTAVFDADTVDDEIKSVSAFCSQNSTQYTISSPLFCDASGDGILGFLAGAAFRMGAESKEEFNEGMAPDEGYGHLLGHSIYFYSKDTGKPVSYTAPAFALKDLGDIPKYRKFDAKSSGTAFWWIEYGGRLDTVHATEDIKWELWKVVYGVWNHIKNSGEFPEAENLTLEWVGTVPGKRESRRFEGDYILTQNDIVQQNRHDDAVSYGGWAIDLHPSDGVYSELDACTQYHSKGVYQVPYRCLYSKNISNLFLAGRIISSTHVAFGSTRVMISCAHNAQAVGSAAAECLKSNTMPRDVNILDLQHRLLRSGQYIPQLDIASDPSDLAQLATISTSSTQSIESISMSDERVDLNCPYGLIFPVSKGRLPILTSYFTSEKEATVELQLRSASKAGNYTPDTILASQSHTIQAGENVAVRADFEYDCPIDQYLFFCIMPVEGVSVSLSNDVLTGITTAYHGQHKAVAKSAVQTVPEESGVESFEFWLPKRRKQGKNLAVTFEPALNPYSVEHLKNSYERPIHQSNAWVAAADDQSPKLTLNWENPQKLSSLTICLDTDMDHPMETVQWVHPERIMPLCVRKFTIANESGNILTEVSNNYQTRLTIDLPIAEYSTLHINFENDGDTPPSVFKIIVN